jgi:hypothetical protein
MDGRRVGHDVERQAQHGYGGSKTVASRVGETYGGEETFHEKVRTLVDKGVDKAGYASGAGRWVASGSTGGHISDQPIARTTSRASSAVSLGVRPTRTPAASSATCLPAAVPDEPETIAPAWPIVLPSGAVKPAT